MIFLKQKKIKNELEYNINEKIEIKEILYEDLLDNIFYSECSEISTKEKSSEKESIYLEMDSLLINIKSKEVIYEKETFSSLYDEINFNNIIDIKCIFNNCVSLLSLPDISKWNTNNINDMSGILGNCKSLSSLPYISKWNTNNVYDMSGMFFNCESLLSIPVISKWNTKDVNDMSGMFFNC